MNISINKKRILLQSLIYLTTIPFLLLFFQSNGTPENTYFILGNILGLIGGVLMYWSFMLGIRYIAAALSPDVLWINKLHKDIGIYGIIFVLFHPLLSMYTYLQDLWWVVTPNLASELEKQITLGRFAFFLFLIIWFSSYLLREKLKYRPWLYIHYLTYPLTFLVLLHGLKIGTFIEQFTFLKVIWLFMTGSFVAAVIYRIAKLAGLGNAKYKLKDKQAVGNDQYLLTFIPKHGQKTPDIGQYFHIQLHPFGEAHPYTITSMDVDSSELTFGVKVYGKFSKAFSEIEIGQKILLDGPYGTFTKESQNSNPKVLIAGSIGITPFIEVIKNYSNDNTTLLYSNGREDEILYKDLLVEKLDKKFWSFITQEEAKGINTINERISVKHIKDIIGEDNVCNQTYYICGSEGFIKAIYEMLINLGVSKKAILFESF